MPDPASAQAAGTAGSDPPGRRFSIELFHELCRAVVAAGYETRRFDDDSGEAGRTFFLRHDVDISPRNALALGIAAASHGIRSNFFFQLNAETYQFLSTDVLRIVGELRALGHLVGLHIDQALFGDDEDRIARTIEWVNGSVTPIDRAISFHRPTPEVVGRAYSAFINAYDPRFFRPESYMSDSRRSLEFVDRLLTTLEQGEPLVQVLLHPEWWSDAGEPAQIWQALCDRRRYELFRYVGSNFAKVFADVEAIEDRDFGI